MPNILAKEFIFLIDRVKLEQTLVCGGVPQSSMSSMKDALLFREGLGHIANGRSLVMTPEFY